MTEDMKSDSSNKVIKTQAVNEQEDARFEVESCQSYQSRVEDTKQDSFANACKQLNQSILQRFSVKKETKRDAILKGGPHDTNFFTLFEIYLEEAISELISTKN